MSKRKIFEIKNFLSVSSLKYNLYLNAKKIFEN